MVEDETRRREVSMWSVMVRRDWERLGEMGEMEFISVRSETEEKVEKGGRERREY